MLERFGRSPNDDRAWRMRAVPLDKDGDHRALGPGAPDEPLDGMLEALEASLLSMFGEQQEAFEVAEAVMDETNHLTGELEAMLHPGRRLVGRMWNRARWRWLDFSRISAEARDTSGNQVEIAHPDRIPTIAWREG